jgi:hypothetical protein
MYKRGECSMLNVLRLSLSGLVVAVLCLASPCQALINSDPDVKYYPAKDATMGTFLGSQILGITDTVAQAYGDAGQPIPDPATQYADSNTAVFENLYTGGPTRNFVLDQFNPNRILPNGDQVGELQGVLLYFTVKLKSGRKVIDNETAAMISGVTARIGADLHVWSDDPTIGIHFEAHPRVTPLPKDLAVDMDSADGKPKWWLMTQEQIEAVSTGTDRLAAIIDPTDPANSYDQNPIYTKINDPAALAAFVGTGKILFKFDSDPNTSSSALNQGVTTWSVPPQFDIEARVVYLYAAPEPASMGLLAAAFIPVLARRRRKRESRLS